MATLTVPLSRIEGHARAVINFRGGEVLSAHFQATELRGFELLIRACPRSRYLCSCRGFVASARRPTIWPPSRRWRMPAVSSHLPPPYRS